MFHIIHFVERWGRGIDLILSKEPTADFKEVGTHFISVFKRKSVDEGVENGGQKSGQKSGQIISKRQREILDIIKDNPTISREELSKTLSINPSAVQRHLNKLKEKGLLKRIGPDKGGHWEVVE
jgi:ATP-dependent DNA helicase RecG